MKASLEAGHVVTLPTANTIADGVAVKTPGDLVFPYVQKNVDRVLSIPDAELVDALLDVMEKHKMVVENAGLLNRGRIFTFSVLLPDRPGELMRVSGLLARNSGNIIKLEHNQFVNINRQNGVELKVTLEAFGQDHKRQILDELRQNGYSVQEVMTADFYH